MNPLKSITGTIVTGIVVAAIVMIIFADGSSDTWNSLMDWDMEFRISNRKGLSEEGRKNYAVTAVVKIEKKKLCTFTNIFM